VQLAEQRKVGGARPGAQKEFVAGVEVGLEELEKASEVLLDDSGGARGCGGPVVSARQRVRARIEKAAPLDLLASLPTTVRRRSTCLAAMNSPAFSRWAGGTPKPDWLAMPKPAVSMS